MYPIAIQKAIDGDNLTEMSVRLAFIRESVNFFEKILPMSSIWQFLRLSVINIHLLSVLEMCIG